MENTEEKVKMDKETERMKREYKYALENLERIKDDVSDVLKTREKLSIELSELQKQVTEVLNEISEEKLSWASRKHTELLELDGKREEVQAILDRKEMLDEQENKVKRINEENAEIRNEARRLEVKNKYEMKLIETQKNEVAEEWAKIHQEWERLKNDKQNFKNRVVQVISEVNNL